MFCPRCGSQNAETTKFCRQCGLPLLEVTHFVASGGTSTLLPPPAGMPAGPANFTLQQKMILSVLAFTILPIVALIVMTETFNMGDGFVPLFLALIPLGITLSVMYFRNQIKWQEQLMRNLTQNQAHLGQPINTQAYQPPQPQAYLQAPLIAVSDPNATPSRPGQNTNPLNKQPVSVVEDETRRFSKQ